MSLLSKRIDKQIAAYQRELMDTHYQEVDNMYRQIRGWRHDYRNHIQTMKVLAANGDILSVSRRLGLVAAACKHKVQSRQPPCGSGRKRFRQIHLHQAAVPPL